MNVEKKHLFDIGEKWLKQEIIPTGLLNYQLNSLLD